MAVSSLTIRRKVNPCFAPDRQGSQTKSLGRPGAFRGKAGKDKYVAGVSGMSEFFKEDVHESN
jgi:hypothetical protein